MKALDTNVLIRYLVRDDPGQAARADVVFGRAARDAAPLHVSLLVVAEVVWVLESAYGFGPDEVKEALELLLQTRELDFADRDLLRAALLDAGRGLGGLADCIIGRLGSAAACEATLTFDRALRRNPAFEVLAG